MNTTIRHPHYGPQGQPFAVRVHTAGGVALSHRWTEADAWDARDAALDAGAVSVRILGLPTRGFAVVPQLPGLVIVES